MGVPDPQWLVVPTLRSLAYQSDLYRKKAMTKPVLLYVRQNRSNIKILRWAR